MTSAPRRIFGRQIFGTGPLTIHVHRHLFTGTLAPHDHDFLEAVMILSGTGTHHTAQGDTALLPGHVLFLRPGTWHAYLDCEELDYINCCFGAELLRGVLDEPLLTRTASTVLQPDDLDFCLRTLESIERSQSGLERLGYLLVFLARLAEQVPPETVAHTPHPSTTLIKSQLEEALSRPWTLTELAALAYLEPTYFVRRFRADTGLPPMAWLARLRAERAATLLLQTNLSIQEIGERVGWSDLSYFARRFRAHFGCSPSAYRVRLGQANATSAGLAYSR